MRKLCATASLRAFAARADAMTYAEFAVTTNFSFLRGASHPEEMVAQAAALGPAGVGIADRNSLAGVVRAHVYARENPDVVHDLRFAPGARLVFADGTPDILAYPQEPRRLWAACRGCSRAAICAPRRANARCSSTISREHAEGLQFAVLERASGAAGSMRPRSTARIAALQELAPGRVWLAAAMTYGRSMRRTLIARHALAAKHRPAADRHQRRAHAHAARGGRSPTCSPASARASPSTRPARGSPPTPSAI